MSARAGFIGVGRMGAAMARAALRGGLAVGVYDARPEASEALAALGATVCPSPRAVAQESDVAAVVVLDDQQVRDVFFGDRGLLAGATSGLCVAIHSTVHVDTVYEVARAAADVGVEVVDAGVTGSVEGAESGQLATMVGGSPEGLERCRELFDCYSGLICRMGGLGSGMKAKIARQAILFLQAAALNEGMRLAEAAGVDLAALGDVVRHSDKINRVQETLWMRGTAGPADPTTEIGRRMLEAGKYTAEIAQKDLGAALGLARSIGIELPFCEQAIVRMPEVWGVA